MTNPKDKELQIWIDESKLFTPKDWERIRRGLGPRHRIPFGMAYGMGAERLRQKFLKVDQAADSTRYALSAYGRPRKKTLKQRLKHMYKYIRHVIRWIVILAITYLFFVGIQLPPTDIFHQTFWGLTCYLLAYTTYQVTRANFSWIGLWGKITHFIKQ